MMVLIAIKNKGQDYKQFLDSMFRKIDSRIVEKCINFLQSNKYIEDFKLTEKGDFSIKNNINPVAIEFMLKLTQLPEFPLHLKLRPLIHLKTFKDSETFIKDRHKLDYKNYEIETLLLGRLGIGSSKNDNKDNFYEEYMSDMAIFDMYINGELIYHKNISSVPGDLASLFKESLYLLRLLMKMKKIGWIDISNEDLLRVVHSIRFGIDIDYCYIPTIPRIGYIRANLIKEFLKNFFANDTRVKNLNMTSKVSDLIDVINSERGLFEDYVINFYRKIRNASDSRVKSEITKLSNILSNTHGNKYTKMNYINIADKDRYLVDREVLEVAVIESLGKTKLTKQELREITSSPTIELYQRFVES